MKDENTNDPKKEQKKKKVSNPHDAYVNLMLKKKENAKDFLSNYLPSDIQKQIDFETLKIEDNIHIDQELDHLYTDILYKVKIAGKNSFVYVLFEHKSYVDWQIAFQLLRYMISVWEKYLSEHPNTKKLPFIFPLVLYHGKEEWKVSKKFSSLIDIIPHGEKYVPDFEYELNDITHMSDGDIAGLLFNKAFLLLLKYNKGRDIFKGLPKIFELLNQLPDNQTYFEYIIISVRYLIETAEKNKNELIKEINHSLKKGAEIMPTIADDIRKEAIEETKKEVAEKYISNMIKKDMTNEEIRAITGDSIPHINEIRKKLKA